MTTMQAPAGQRPLASAPTAIATERPHNTEEYLRWRLKRNRTVATGLLAVMAVIFTATRLVPEPGFAVRLLQAEAEAGFVGGIADWFAVTALFRHARGLPIPHTAIIPSNKEQIGRALGSSSGIF
jgi:uncharacterized membrane-anchored protein YjiN (DUF445 family)